MNKIITGSLLQQWLFIVLIGFGPSAVGNDFAKYDIVGLRLDMTFEEAQKTLRKHVGPSVQVALAGGSIDAVENSRLRGLTWNDGAITSRRMGSNITKQEDIWVQGAAPPHRGKVMAIYRQAYFEEPLKAENFTKALEEKYGPVKYERGPKPHPTNPRWGDYNHIWSWSVTPSGQPIADDIKLAACLGTINVAQNPTVIKDNMLFLTKTSNASTFNGGAAKHCGKVLAIVSQEDRRQAIHGYYIVMYDMQAIERMNQDTVQFSIAEAEKIRREREEKLQSAKKPVL